MFKTVCLIWIVVLLFPVVWSIWSIHTETFTNNPKGTIKTTLKKASKPSSTGDLVKMVKKMHEEGPLKKMPNLKQAQATLHNAQNLQHQLEPIYYSLVPKPTDDDATVNLLWSGGVASTYRLCKLLFVYKRKVRPVFFAQQGLDKRKSSYQERLTVRELHKYIHEHYPSTKTTLLPLFMYDTRIIKTQTNQKTIEALASVFQTQPYRIAPFYLALMNIRKELQRPHTELSSRPLEITLPHNGPHQMLRNAVEKWGTRISFGAHVNPEKPLSTWFGEAEDVAPPDERAIGKCMYVVTTPATMDTHEQQRHASFASLFGHLRFVLPCDSPPTIHHTAKKHDFMKVLQRTWSCREPVLTGKQQYEEKQKTNRLIQMPTVPVGACGHCVSCLQRAWDGVARVG